MQLFWAWERFFHQKMLLYHDNFGNLSGLNCEQPGSPSFWGLFKKYDQVLDFRIWYFLGIPSQHGTQTMSPGVFKSGDVVHETLGFNQQNLQSGGYQHLVDSYRNYRNKHNSVSVSWITKIRAKKASNTTTVGSMKFDPTNHTFFFWESSSDLLSKKIGASSVMVCSKCTHPLFHLLATFPS